VRMTYIQSSLTLNILLLVIFMGEGMASILVKQEDPRIVHGEEAPLNSLPYQVSVQLMYNTRLVTTKPSHFCGGALIAENWVLSAAHCVRGQTAKKLKIVGGTNDITDLESPTYRVKKIVRHNYNDITKVNDLSLLKLERNHKDSNRDSAASPHPFLPVNLCSERFEPQGKNCTVSGWGHMKSKGGGVPDKLREVSVSVLHDKICAKMLAGYPWDSKDKTMLCAGGADKDACQGDSGGPLVCHQEGHSRCIAGVVSWGVGCATEGIPGVYTNVRKYNKWIEGVLAEK